MKSTHLRTSLLIVLAAAPSGALAQQTGVALPFEPCALLAGSGPAGVTGSAEELRRLAELGGDMHVRSMTVRRASDPGAPGDCPEHAAAPLFESGPVAIELVPLRVGTWVNGGYPDDRNNGFVWAGRGVSTAITGGVAAHVGPVSAGFIPGLAWQQNSDFEIVPRSSPGFPVYRNPFYSGIDYPQRMGEESFVEADWAGQSFLRVDAWGLAAGISHENLLVGPAIRNPIVLSATAPGFTHLFASTSRPLDLWIAELDLELVLGRVEESEHFDSVSTNDVSHLAIWSFSVSPRGLDGLEVGVARSYMFRPDDQDALFDFGGLEGFFSLGSDSNLPGNELAALFGRWVFPEVGAEVYAEWARNDRFSGVTDDFIPEPDHSQAYLFGIQKVTEVGPGAIRVEAELNHLQEKQETRHGRSPPVYYTHERVRQGYTNRGQILGAGIGPGADAQFIGVDWMDWWGYAGVFVERVRRNDASNAAIAARLDWPYEHDTELTGGVRGLFLWNGLSAAGSLGYSHRWDRDFLEDASSLRLTLEVSAWPALLEGIR